MKPTKHLVYFFLFFGLSVFAQKATISEVIIQGAHKTSHNLIRSLISTKSGIVLDSTAIAKDVTLLKRLPAFNHVYYQVIADKNQEYIVKAYDICNNLIGESKVFSLANPLENEKIITTIPPTPTQSPFTPRPNPNPTPQPDEKGFSDKIIPTFTDRIVVLVRQS